MKVCIRYRTEYRYEQAVSFSRHVFRLFPKADTHLTVEKFDFKTNPDADVQFRRDVFDNITGHCFYPEKSAALSVHLDMDLRVQKKNAFHFLLAPHAVELPFQYEPREREILEPFLQPGSHCVEMPFWKFQPKSTVSALVELNAAIHDNLKYEVREHGAARTPAETLAAGAGACRDYAVLLAETLRGIGVAARLASGYLCESGEGELRARGALHAWAEACLPGAGWVGMDPTNGVFCNHNHITAAVGLLPEDVAPISGSYFSNQHVPSQMSASLEVQQCDEQAA